jgi:DNA-binding transcriptional LysR family regulator
MQIQQIRYFLAVYAEESISGAARRCEITQPSLSKALFRLESEIGGSLFTRGKNRTRPTELARLLKEHLTTIVHAEEMAKQAAEQFLRHRSQWKGASHAESDLRGDPAFVGPGDRRTHPSSADCDGIAFQPE